jgi:hypothetical protein
LLALHFLPL